MTHPTAVLNVVALSPELIGERTPHVQRYLEHGEMHRLHPGLAAVTCSVQSSMLTGARPSEHGVVGNGWFNRDLQEIQFWKQSNRLVRGEKVWEAARKRDPRVTCANMFWWFNMHSSVDVYCTPRPQYKADGRKIPDVYTEPPELRDDLQRALGRFPLFNFWGPAASIASSAWIAEATKRVVDRSHPTLTLVYLPHLDYPLQKYGPGDPRVGPELEAIDEIVGDLLTFFRERGTRVLIVSEYAIEPVSRPIHPNRVLREAGLLRVRDEGGDEILDAGASDAFAVADHQVAYVYVKDPSNLARVADLFHGLDGVDEVLRGEARARAGLDHERAGEIVLVADEGAWFTYYYWLDDARAPDFARTVEIHRKPGYDPVELFLDPNRAFPKARIASKLLRRKLGFRTLLDVIPLDATLVKGSHGRIRTAAERRPVLLTQRPVADSHPPNHEVPAAHVKNVILDHLFGE